VDLAIVLVSTERVPSVIAEAGPSGVRSAVIFTAGFAELGSEGKQTQQELNRISHETGIRVFGPNCIGYVNPGARTVAMVVPPPSVPAGMRAGAAALISQSGGLMISSLEYGSQVGLGFRLLASTGNEADVSTLDVLEATIPSADVRCIGLIAEGIADGRRLLDLAQRAHEVGKRIAVLKLGRSSRGAQAVLTHTAVLAGSQRVFDAACRDAGIVQVRTMSELVEQLVLLEKPQPRRRTPGGLAAMTISGGTKVLIADIAADEDLDLAQLSGRTKKQLAEAVPDLADPDNPLDLNAPGIEYTTVVGTCVRILASDPNVGTIALILHLRKSGGGEALVGLVRAFCAAQEAVAARLVVVSSIPEGVSGFWREQAALGPVPFLNDLASLRAILALEHEAAAGPPSLPVRPRSRPPAIVARALAAGQQVLGEAAARTILAEAGIPLVEGSLATSAEAAVEAAERLGYPVAVKLAAGSVTHKTELGGVRLGLATSGAVTDAYGEVVAAAAAAPGLVIDGVLVQRMAPAGVELIVGVSRDPQFGPVVTVGLGGVLAEVLDDVAVRLGPVSVPAARAMLRDLRGSRLLRGWRGRPPLAMDQAARAISDLSKLGAALSPWVDSLEVNPLLVTEAGALALDAVAVLSRGHGTQT
jgi:acyl-CoA synthetase (NDP forming)